MELLTSQNDENHLGKAAFPLNLFDVLLIFQNTLFARLLRHHLCKATTCSFDLCKRMSLTPTVPQAIFDISSYGSEIQDMEQLEIS